LRPIWDCMLPRVEVSGALASAVGRRRSWSRMHLTTAAL